MQGERPPEPRLFAYHTHVALRAPTENRHAWRPWLMLGLLAVACTALAFALVAWLISFDVDGLLVALRAYVSLAITR